MTLDETRDPIAIAFDPGLVQAPGASPQRSFTASAFRASRPGYPIQEVRLAASPEVRDHRRRILDHQEKVEAEQRTAAAQPSEPQLRIPLIGEVRRPEPATPKRKRSRAKKPVQPDLGEF